MSQLNNFVFEPVGQNLLFRGKFEELYKTEADPWEQSAGFAKGEMGKYYLYSRTRLAATLRVRKVIGPGIEFGCGLGYSTAFYAEALSVIMTGVDISPTAIDKATALQNKYQCGFTTGNLLDPNFNPFPRYQFVIMGQMLWYVLEDLGTAVLNCLKCIPSGGLFVISQAFLREQKYGREVCDGLSGTVRYLTEHYSNLMQLIEVHYDDSDKYIHRDGVILFRKK